MIKFRWSSRRCGPEIIFPGWNILLRARVPFASNDFFYERNIPDFEIERLGENRSKVFRVNKREMRHRMEKFIEKELAEL